MGKHVRDQIHAAAVAGLLLKFFRHPRSGEVYNIGGGRANSLSILETVDLLAGLGYRLRYEYIEQNRKGDHICYISDLTKAHSQFPEWKIEYGLDRIVDEIVDWNLRHVAVR